jgi:uncharacterized protein YbjT (DUF2867 family)
MQTIAVAGATGRVGGHAVDLLWDRGHTVVPIARAHGVDVITGEGLAAALAGVDVVIDATSGPAANQEEATAFFTTAARNLQQAGAAAGVKGVAVVSIVGVDRFTSGYGAAKIAHERAATAGPVPVRILRAAQLHELVPQLVDGGRKGDVGYVPAMRTQLVAARTVAEALVDLATADWSRGTHGGPVPEVAGPRAERLVEMAALYAARRGAPGRVEEVSDPDDPQSDLYASGALLPGPHALLAGPTFAEWLAEAA